MMSDDLYTEAAEDVYDAYFRVSDFAKVPYYPNAAAILRERFIPRVTGPHDGLIERLETFGAWAEVADRHRLTKDAAAAIASLQAELDEARDALMPFAEIAKWIDNTDARRDAIYCGGVPGLRCEVKQSDYHRALAALGDKQ